MLYQCLHLRIALSLKEKFLLIYSTCLSLYSTLYYFCFLMMFGISLTQQSRKADAGLFY